MAPTHSYSARGARLASLDVLRAVAVLLVIGRHMKPPADGMFAPGIDTIMRAWQRGGWVGVDLFFVLSGFLVSGLLFREYQQRGAVSAGRFLLRRGLKIYPAFYVLLAAGVIVEATLGYRWLNLGGSNVLAEALFVQNYAPSVFGHTWSLAVEEHFYLLCAGLIFYLARHHHRRAGDPFRIIPVIVVAVGVAALTARVVNAAAAPYANKTHLYPTHLRLDGLMFGVGLSYLYHFKRHALDAALGTKRRLAVSMGIALILPAFVFELDRTPFIYTLGLTLFYLGSGLLVAAAALGELRWTPLVRGLAFFGTYSYSIYLWHTLVQQSFNQVQTDLNLLNWPLAGFAVYFAGAIAIGTLMAKIVEIPVLKIRDRLLPSKAGTALPAPERQMPFDAKREHREREGRPG